jgi:hypothetical protein
MTSQAQLKLMLAGGLAGAAAKTCTAPLGRLTILYQLKAFEGTQPSVWKGLKYIVEKQVCCIAAVFTRCTTNALTLLDASKCACKR